MKPVNPLSLPGTAPESGVGAAVFAEASVSCGFFSSVVFSRWLTVSLHIRETRLGAVPLGVCVLFLSFSHTPVAMKITFGFL